MSANSRSSSLAIPLHSTGNNSLSEVRGSEAQLQENMTITDLSHVLKDKEVKIETLKYTCLDCDYKTKTKSHMDNRGGQKNQKLDFELAPYLIPFSLLY